MSRGSNDSKYTVGIGSGLTGGTFAAAISKTFHTSEWLPVILFFTPILSTIVWLLADWCIEDLKRRREKAVFIQSKNDALENINKALQEADLPPEVQENFKASKLEVLNIEIRRSVEEVRKSANIPIDEKSARPKK